MASLIARIGAILRDWKAKALSATKPLKRLRRKLDQPDRLLGRSAAGAIA